MLISLLPSACVRNILILCFTSNMSFILCKNYRTLHVCLPLTNGWEYNTLSQKTTPNSLIYFYHSAVWRCLWPTTNSNGPFYSTPDDEWIWTTKRLANNHKPRTEVSRCGTQISVVRNRRPTASCVTVLLLSLQNVLYTGVPRVKVTTSGECSLC